MRNLSVGQLVAEVGDKLSIHIEAGHKGLDRRILSSKIYRPGLALTWYSGLLFTQNRIQVLGNTEMLYLNGLTEVERRATLEENYQLDPVCSGHGGL